MEHIVRSSYAGKFLRAVTGKKILKYPEERDDFQLPACYADSPALEAPLQSRVDTAPDEELMGRRNSSQASEPNPLPKITTRSELERVHTQLDIERLYTAAAQREELKHTPSRPIAPTKSSDGTILVDWYSTDDPENPRNWSSGKKIFVASLINLYTLAVYTGSSIYTPSTQAVEEKFGVSAAAASLGLALYVLGYGTGPVIFSPLSEIPSIGRNPPYILTFGLFVILCVPTALVNNFPGLLVLRFLQGFFGSPCLATGGASLSDLYNFLQLPYSIAIWAVSATLGPALGPVVSGFSVPAENWRWSLWEILWMAGPAFLAMLFFLPETSPDTILLNRAQRLRKLTGNNKLKSQSEIDQKKLTVSAVAVAALYRPIQIVVLDPAMLFVNLYTSLVYGTYYSFFEAFPIVYIGIYGFNFGQMGLVFLCIVVALAIAVPLYFLYLRKVFEPEIKTKGLLAPERRLIPALAASFLPPIGLFIFGWTARPEIHWIVSVIGITIFTVGIFQVIQCIFIYIPMTYPQYAASLFAGNDFMRSAFACAAILFGRPLYLNLGVGPGVSLLAGLAVGCIGGIFALYYFGANLRARSRFTAK